MKIRHWVIQNQSGMHHLALAVAEGERRLGHDALVVDAANDDLWGDPAHRDADVYGIHSRIPSAVIGGIRNASGKAPRLVFYSHGIPEHLIELSVLDFNAVDKPNPIDLWAMTRYWLKEADAFVVFCPRQQALYNTMLPRERRVDCVPLGVDRAFWSTEPNTIERLRGEPAVWMSENQNRIKWALDVLLAWPSVAAKVPSVYLHAHWIPMDLHRFFVDLANTNGATYHATITPKFYGHETLRMFWAGCDYMLATTRYGDNTCVTMQAEAAGLKTISYPGNEHASYWISEGDQRVMAAQLADIFTGTTPPRADKLPVPDITDMAKATIAVYSRTMRTQEIVSVL
jgi:hypothetical protein